MRYLLSRAAAMLLVAAAYAVFLVSTFFWGSGWAGDSLLELSWFPVAGSVALFAGFVAWRRERAGPRARAADVALLCAVTIAGAVLGLRFAGAVGGAPASRSLGQGDGFAQCGGAELFFHVTEGPGSEKPPMIVLHGGPGSGSPMVRSDVEPMLSDRFRLVFFDQRGTGRSSAGRAFTLGDYVADVECVRRAVGIERAFLLGVSWGGALADEYALRHPGRVRAVITWGGLVDAQAETRTLIRALEAHGLEAGEDASQRRFTLWQTMKVMNRVNRAHLKSALGEEHENELFLAALEKARGWGYERSQVGANLRAMAATMMQLPLVDYDFAPKFPKLSMPYLFLHGDRDPEIDPALVNRYARSMPEARVVTIPGSGHLLDRPRETADAIAAFALGQPASSGAAPR